MPIDYFDELAGSPTVEIQLNGGSAKREAKIPWANLLDLADYLFPFGSNYPATFPTMPWLYAHSMHVEPFIADKDVLVTPVKTDLTYDSINTTEFAKVSIEYSSLGYNTDELNTQNLDPVALLSHRWSIGGEFLTLESTGLRWCNGDKVSDEITAGLLIPTIEHQITWPRIQKPPFNTMRDRIGCVNDAVMTFQTGPIYPETLLFLGAELHREIKTDGTLGWEVVYRFSEKRIRLGTLESFAACENPDSEDECVAAGGTWIVPTTPAGNPNPPYCLAPTGGWNHFYRSDNHDSGFMRLTAGAGSPIYFRKSFSELFVEDL